MIHSILRTLPLFFAIVITALVCRAGIAADPPASKPAAGEKSAPAAAAKPATQPAVDNWFPGMLHPPKVDVKLPDDFTLASLGPTDEWSMYDGVIWTPPRSAKRYAHSKEKSFLTLEDPLVWVHLSKDAGQIPGTDNFNVEKDLDAMVKAVGAKNVSTKKLHWGTYPVLEFTGDRPNGSPFFTAWVGINSPDGWALFIDYRVPKGEGHPTKDEQAIWQHLMEDTKATP